VALEVGDIVANLIGRVDTTSFKTFDRAVEHSRERTEKLHETLRDLAKMTAAGLGFYKLAEQLKESTDAALTQQEALALYEAQARKVHGGVETLVKRLEELENVQRKRGFTDTEITKAMTANLRVTHSWREAVKFLNAETDTARSRQMKLNDVMPMFLRGALGMVGGFRRVGLQVTATTAATTAARGELTKHTESIDTHIKKLKDQESAQINQLQGQHATSQSLFAVRQAYKRVIDSLEDQKKKLKDAAAAQIEHGKHIDANKTKASIAAQIEKQVGGSAEESSKTAIGSYRRFNAELDRVREQFGEKLLPAITQTMDYLSGPGIEKAHAFAHAVEPEVSLLVSMFKDAYTAIDAVVRLLGGQETVAAGVAVYGIYKTMRLIRSEAVAIALLEIFTNPAGLWAGFMAAIGAAEVEMGVLGAMFSPEAALAIGVTAIGLAIYKWSGWFDKAKSHADDLTDSTSKLRQVVKDINDLQLAQRDAALGLLIAQRERVELQKRLATLQREGKGHSTEALRIEQDLAQNSAEQAGYRKRIADADTKRAEAGQRQAAAINQATRVPSQRLDALASERARLVQRRTAIQTPGVQPGEPSLGLQTPGDLQKVQHRIDEIDRAERWQRQELNRSLGRARGAFTANALFDANRARSLAGDAPLSRTTQSAFADMVRQLSTARRPIPLGLQRVTDAWAGGAQGGANIRTIDRLVGQARARGATPDQLMRIITDAKGPRDAISDLRRELKKLETPQQIRVRNRQALASIQQVQGAINRLGQSASMALGIAWPPVGNQPQYPPFNIGQTPVTTRAHGGKETKPTYHVISGEDTDRGRWPEYFIPTKPQHRPNAMRLFSDLARDLGVTMMAHGGKDGTSTTTAGPDSTKTGKKTRTITVQTPGGPVQVQVNVPTQPKDTTDPWQAYTDKREQIYQLASSRIQVQTARAQATPGTSDDASAIDAQMRLNRTRQAELSGLINDPRTRTRPAIGTSLRQEQAQLITELADLRNQRVQLITQAGGLTPRQQYQLAEAQRRGTTGTELTLLRREQATLDRARRAAVRAGDFTSALAYSTQQAQIKQQIDQASAPTADAQAYLSTLQTEAASLLGMRASFVRTTRPGSRGVSLASVAGGVHGVVVHQTIHTLHPGDPVTLRKLAEANASAASIVQRPRHTNLPAHGPL
jgi:hypothetical protein